MAWTPSSLNRFTRGFTLLELLFTLILFSLVMSLSLVAFRAVFVKAELTLARQNLEDLIEYARAQSLARGKPVELCSSEDGQHCDDLKVRTEWRAKLLVLSDGQVLQSKTAFSSSLRVYWLAGFDRANNLHFETSGFIGAQQGSFYLCPRAPFRYLAQALVVLRSGRLRLVDDYSMLADVCG